MPLRELLTAISEQETCDKICFKGNLLVARFKEDVKEITQNVIKNLITLNEEIIRGYGGILTNLMTLYPETLHVSFLFTMIT